MDVTLLIRRINTKHANIKLTSTATDKSTKIVSKKVTIKTNRSPLGANKK